MPSLFDKEKTRKKIDLVLDMMQNETDPVLLNEYRKYFKKEVSLFRRSWVAGWLLMNFDKSDSAGARRTYQDNRIKNDELRSSLSEDESKRLFISIGKNRHIYPREILSLIIAKTSIPREDIGGIRILDNYSFVQVRDIQAEKIIAALNGLLFRGRTLIVNYAKSKNGEMNDFQSEGNTPEQEQDDSDKKEI